MTGSLRLAALLVPFAVWACADGAGYVEPVDNTVEQAEKTIKRVEKSTYEWLMRKFSSRGYPRDPEKIARRLRAEAKSGNVWAQSWLGELYLYGFGVEADPLKRTKWHARAATGGNRISQYYMGFIRLEGVGVRQDYPKALAWFRRSAAQGFAAANKKAACLKPKPEAKNLPQALKNLVEAERAVAPSYSPKAADMDFTSGISSWLSGCSTEEQKSGFRSLLAAAKAGHKRAAYLLGVAYDSGMGIPVSRAMAAKWYVMAGRKPPFGRVDALPIPETRSRR